MAAAVTKDLRSARGLNDPFDRVCLHNDPIFTQLFLHEDNFLRAFYNEVSTRIQGTLVHASKLRLSFPGQDAFITSEHDWQPPYVDVGPSNDTLSSSILNGD